MAKIGQKSKTMNENALTIAKIQGLSIQIAENLSKIKPVTIEQEQTKCMATEEFDVFIKLTLFELQKSFES